MALTDYLSIIFDRSDRYPGMHEYGAATDKAVADLVGGQQNFDLTKPNPRAKLIALRGEVELHETGPIIVVEANRAANLEQLHPALRQMATDWGRRSAPDEEVQPKISVRLGPPPEWPHELYSAVGRVKVTVDPQVVVHRLDEVISWVMSCR